MRTSYVQLVDRTTPVDLSKVWAYGGKQYTVLRPVVQGIIDRSPDDATRRADLMNIGLLEVISSINDTSVTNAKVTETTPTITDNGDHITQVYLIRDMTQEERLARTDVLKVDEQKMFYGMFQLFANVLTAHQRDLQQIRNTFADQSIPVDDTTYGLGVIQTLWLGYKDEADPDFQGIDDEKLDNFMEREFI